jgi:hypothetical protein
MSDQPSAMGHDAGSAGAGWFLSSIWSVWFIWLNEINQMNKTNQMNQINLSSQPFLLDLAGGIRLIRQSIQDRLKLQACLLQHLFIGISRDPDRGAPQVEASGPRVWDHESIPAREEFFFEQLNASGTIGSPVAFAS